MCVALSTAFFQHIDGESALFQGRAVRAAAWGEPYRLEPAGIPVEPRLAGLGDLDPTVHAVLMVGEGTGYSPAEVEALRAFLVDGGRLLVASRGGAAVQLLDQLGAGISLERSAVYTPAFRATPDRPIALSTGRLPALPSEVVVPGARPVLGGEPLLETPDLSWIDLDNDRRPDVGEPVGAIPVAASIAVGRGLVVVVGSPSLVLEGPHDVSRALVDLVASGRIVLLDESHRARSDPFRVAGILAGALPSLVGVAILMMVGLLGAAAVLRPRLERVLAAGPHRAVEIDPLVLGEILSELDKE